MTTGDRMTVIRWRGLQKKKYPLIITITSPKFTSQPGNLLQNSLSKELGAAPMPQNEKADLTLRAYTPK